MVLTGIGQLERAESLVVRSSCLCAALRSVLQPNLESGCGSLFQEALANILSRLPGGNSRDCGALHHERKGFLVN
jgi:hypothetical protein